MRRLIPTIFLVIASLALAKPSKEPEGPEPPPLAEVMKKNASSSHTALDTTQSSTAADPDTPSKPIPDSAAPPDPDIKMIKKADAVIEEYRFNNKLYMVKVTPKVGKPYYLYDEEGEGNMIRHDDSHIHTSPPRWTLFSW